jgi:nitrate/TMAO reductase-like tetraheme cytochrome c subunit
MRGAAGRRAVEARTRRWGRRLLTLAATLFLGGLFLTAVGAIGMYGVVHHTAQPEFCDNCHIMEPYYASWESSTHSDVACIECHYEPGAVETLEGKFKALSQLAKYVTRTQGTKPWAEVSDQSCMRSGCHSVRMLEGEVEFKSVAFDHRHHLLESRRGRRLRCVTCHSQIVQGEHVSVTTSVCFMCHFMPDSHGEVPQKTSDCLLCHGPPDEPVLVAGREFVHADYVERGVSCRECHDPVISGEGTVRRERCHTCHAEVGHIERIAEQEFLHEKHVTEHKVECFDCHDQISHGLLELPRLSDAADAEGCGSCHMTPHQAAESLYAGTGAHGVADNPSRMHATRVSCRACHTGRTPVRRGDDLDSEHPKVHGGLVAAAGEVDCLHCHGTGYAGMLAGWQSAVGAEVARLEPLLEQVESALPELPDHPARQAVGEARANLDLVELDGSSGAHNVTYALDALRASAERIDLARGLLELPASATAASGSPFVSRDGCSSCHLGVETRAVELPDNRSFPHAAHLGGELECSSCHSVEQHGAPAPGRADCASCHHTEASGRDPADCGSCHEAQLAMLTGDVSGHGQVASSMSGMDCYECHGDPPDILRPGPAACIICHEEGFDRLMQDWQSAVGERIERLRASRSQLSGLLADASQQTRELVERSDGALLAVERDGTLGVHNIDLALGLLQEAADQLDKAGADLGRSAYALAEAAPWRPEAGCASCHAGLESRATIRADGRSFSHRKHVEGAGMDCGACHDLEQHGQPSFPRDQCASCHHTPDAQHDANDCGSCHQAQVSLHQGVLAGFASTAGSKSDMECSMCHGSAPDIALPSSGLCSMCHEEGFEEQLARWRGDFEALRERLASSLESDANLTAEQRSRAEGALRLLTEDGSRGVHNPEFSRLLLEEALRPSGSR